MQYKHSVKRINSLRQAYFKLTLTQSALKKLQTSLLTKISSKILLNIIMVLKLKSFSMRTYNITYKKKMKRNDG